MNKSQKINLEQAFDTVGGFGRYQVFATIAMMITRNSGFYLFNAFPYLVMDQKYECRDNATGVYSSCTAEQICDESGPTVTYRVDKSYEYYLNNWFTEMDMVCFSEQAISSMLTLFFVGFAIGGLVMYPLPDKYGRRKSMLFDYALNLICQIGVLAIPQYSTRAFLFGGIGFFQIKNSLSYVWLFESVPSRHKTIACTLINSFDAIPYIVICVYFDHMSSNWLPLQVFMTSLGVLAYVFILLAMPESPRWHLIKGNKEEAIDSLNQIAHFNGSLNRIPFDARFIEDKNEWEDNFVEREIAKLEDEAGPRHKLVVPVVRRRQMSSIAEFTVRRRKFEKVLRK